jgi:HSP20 family protein
MKSMIPWRSKRTELAPKNGPNLPFGDFAFSLSRMRDEFDRLFERIARDFPLFARAEGDGWRWGLDIVDEDDSIVVKAEAPGFDPEDLDLRVEDDRLVLRASKKVETKDDKGKIREVREQECYESVALPAGIDKDKVDAKYHNGLLTVTLPKTERSKAKRISVKSS